MLFPLKWMKSEMIYQTIFSVRLMFYLNVSQFLMAKTYTITFLLFSIRITVVTLTLILQCFRGVIKS